MAYLIANGINSGLHYIISIHMQNAFKSLGYKISAFPVAEKNANECISLLIYPELKINDHDYIINNIQQFFSS
jgi:dTDP-4-amino-4,6-dideoxygalactose transaminase